MTQKQNILAYLKSGRAITPLDALRKFGCFRLSAVIYVLRQEGHSIETYAAEKRHYAKYILKGGA